MSRMASICKQQRRENLRFLSFLPFNRVNILPGEERCNNNLHYRREIL